jgi:hypothetical protein
VGCKGAGGLGGGGGGEGGEGGEGGGGRGGGGERRGVWTAGSRWSRGGVVQPEGTSTGKSGPVGEATYARGSGIMRGPRT